MNFLYLNDDDISSLNIRVADVENEVRDALISLSSGNVEMPPKIGVVPVEGSLIHAMPVFLRDKSICGVKWVGSYPKNPERGLPRVSGFQILNDPDNGLPLCIMDCRRITLYRTAALSVLFARHCLAGDFRTMAVLGAGAQAAIHVRAFHEGFPELSEISAYDINTQSAQKFIVSVNEELKIEGRAASSPQEAVEGADVILSAGVMTPSVHLEWMKDGCIGIGLDMGKVWHADVIDGADGIVTDSEFQLRKRFEKERDSFQSEPKVRIELGDIILKKGLGRLNSKEKLIFVSTGIAANDLVTADLFYKEALKYGVGTKLSM